MNENIKIAWFGKHFGEEPPLSGNSKQGSGNIFFTGCNLKCVFCQNFQISQNDFGKIFDLNELVEIFFDLKNKNCANVNLVSPIIYWRQIQRAIIIAKEKGFDLPFVWNSNGYENIEILKQMKGLIDIYLPDFKYGIDKVAFKYSQIPNYTAICKQAVFEMVSQTGKLNIKNGLAKKGVIVRHLVLPNNLENTFAVLDILSEFKDNIFVSLMCQYFPMYNSNKYPEITRTLYQSEWQKAKDYFYLKGFENGWFQSLESTNCLVPDFTKKNPFRF